MQSRNREVMPPIERVAFVRRFWIPFISDALDCILTMGVVPVRIVRRPLWDLLENAQRPDHVSRDDRQQHPNSSLLPAGVDTRAVARPGAGGAGRMARSLTRNQEVAYPVVVKGNYQITTYYDYDSDEQRFRFYRPVGTRPDLDEQARRMKEHEQGGHGYGVFDPEVTVVHGFGADPTLEGELQSMIARLFPWAARIRELGRLELHAERQRANPVVLMQRPEQLSMRAGAQASGGNDSSLYSARDNVFELNDVRLELSREDAAEKVRQDRAWAARIAQERRAHEDRLRAQLEAGRSDADDPLASMNLSLAAAEVAPPITLPLLPGYQVATRPLPQLQSDFLANHELWQKMVCATFNVPLTMLQDPAGRTVRAPAACGGSARACRHRERN